MNFDSLTEEEQFIIKWKYNLLGDFKTALIHAITHADSDNIEKLALGFPKEVSAYKRYREESGWWEAVTKKAEILHYII